jgi:hypothetical protein
MRDLGHPSRFQLGSRTYFSARTRLAFTELAFYEVVGVDHEFGVRARA